MAESMPELSYLQTATFLFDFGPLSDLKSLNGDQKVCRMLYIISKRRQLFPLVDKVALSALSQCGLAISVKQFVRCNVHTCIWDAQPYRYSEAEDKSDIIINNQKWTHRGGKVHWRSANVLRLYWILIFSIYCANIFRKFGARYFLKYCRRLIILCG